MEALLGGPLQPTWEKKHANASYTVVHMSGQTFLKTDVEVEPGKCNQHQNSKSTYHGGAFFPLAMLDDMSTLIATD